jgi:hypothetical protein
MSEPSEAEVRLLAEALEAMKGSGLRELLRRHGKVNAAFWEREAESLLATGLHVVTDEQAAVIEAAKEMVDLWRNGQGTFVQERALIAAVDAAMKDPQP